MLSTTRAPKQDDLRAFCFPAKIPSIRDTKGMFAELSDGRRLGPRARTEIDRGHFDTGDVARALEPHLSIRHQTNDVLCMDGIRFYPNQQHGQGYWDFFRISNQVIMSIADVRYREDTRFEVPRENILKMRLLLSGKLLSPDGKTLLQAPGATLCFQGKNAGSDYYVASGIDTRLIILHCKPTVFGKLFGLSEEHLPRPIARNGCVGEGGAARSLPISITPAVLHTATDIVNSRDAFSGTLRSTYLYAKCLELITIIVQNFRMTEFLDGNRHRIRERDIHKIAEARGIVLEHLASPPSIERLARLVGINQTQLKSGFKAITGQTIFGYVQRCRMERAAELLLSGTRNISEVSYEVGYSHSANFTMAFKRYFGYLPKELKAKRGSFPT